MSEGIQQSHKLGRYLKEHSDEYNIHRILSSDLTRAVQTTQAIEDELQLPVEHSADWRETNNGLLAGMPEELALQRYPGLFFSTLKMDERFPGGESPVEFAARIQDTLGKICAAQLAGNPDENLLIVTHGGVINVIYHLLLGIPWTNTGHWFPAGNTGVHELTYSQDQWKITRENGLDHLNLVD
ncbi:histidine phosphatase family protein [Paenibacillus donghaensis]|uniref:histidine phosphatase family protein n=1 Tax=Paenibacillus donghaensis TaxID=414771 RepID=UPI001FE2AE51|nr:histidine phosphatase family protein [Paenibacillus donghaensis]